jgi:hypothetical protein
MDSTLGIICIPPLIITPTMKFATIAAALWFALFGWIIDGQIDTMWSNVTEWDNMTEWDNVTEWSNLTDDQILPIDDEIVADDEVDTLMEETDNVTMPEMDNTTMTEPDTALEVSNTSTVVETTAPSEAEPEAVEPEAEEASMSNTTEAEPDMDMEMDMESNMTMTEDGNATNTTGGFTPETNPPQELETDGFTCSPPGEETNTDQCTQYKAGVAVKCECYYFCSGGSLVQCFEKEGETNQFSCSGGDVIECFENPVTKAPVVSAAISSRTFGVAAALAALVGML